MSNHIVLTDNRAYLSLVHKQKVRREVLVNGILTL